MIYFIPARKDSKRIQNKNIMPINGKPLIEYTFDSVQNCIDIADQVIVSTDDDEIIELANHHKFESYKRDSRLCTDKAKMSDVLFDALLHFNPYADSICILYPTSPLRTSKHIREALQLWRARGNVKTMIMSVSPVTYRPYGLMEINNYGFLKCKHPYGELFYQGQNQPIDYRANGAIYIIPKSIIQKKEINSQLFTKRTIPYIMDQVSSLEIDTPDDILIAEYYLSKMNKKKVIMNSVENKDFGYAFTSY